MAVPFPFPFPASCTIIRSSQVKSKSGVHQFVPALEHSKCSFLRITTTNDRGSTSMVIRNATPEVAADVVSGALSIPGIPFILDNPWMSAFAGLFIGVPFVIQKLRSLSKQIDMTAEAMEKIADTVGKVAEEVDKAAEELGESLPEGGLKQMVALVEDMAEETVKDAQVIEDLMDKVGELDDKLEALMNKKSKGADTTT